MFKFNPSSSLPNLLQVQCFWHHCSSNYPGRQLTVSRLVLPFHPPSTHTNIHLFSSQVLQNLPPQFFHVYSILFLLMSIGVLYFMFLWLGIYWASWICELILFTKFGEILVIILSNIYFIPPSFSSPLETLTTYVLGCVTSLSSMMLYSFFPPVFYLSALDFE